MTLCLVWCSTAADSTEVESIRWPDGLWCPRYPQAKVLAMTPPFYRCASCGHDFAVTAGTLFADTHLPLRLWFQAMWYVVNQKSEPVLWVSNGCWAWAAIAPRGTGCTNCAGPWCDQVGTGSPHGGSGRGLHRRRATGQAWAWRGGQGVGGDCRASGREQDRSHSVGAGGGCVGPGVVASRNRRREPWQPSADRWLERLRHTQEQRVSSRNRAGQCNGRCPACCHGPIGWRRCSSGGCWARIRGASPQPIWITIWTNSRSGSTGALPVRGDRFFSGWSSNRWPSRRSAATS